MITLIFARYVFAFIAGWAAFLAASWSVTVLARLNFGMVESSYIRWLLFVFFAQYIAVSGGMVAARFACDRIVGRDLGKRPYAAIWTTALIVAVVSLVGYYLARHDDPDPVHNFAYGGAVLFAIITVGVVLLRGSVEDIVT